MKVEFIESEFWGATLFVALDTYRYRNGAN